MFAAAIWSSLALAGYATRIFSGGGQGHCSFNNGLASTLSVLAWEVSEEAVEKGDRCFQDVVESQQTRRHPPKWRFTKQKFNMKKNKPTHFLDKASRASLLMRWLHAELESRNHKNVDLRSLLWACHHAVGIMADGGDFLTGPECSQVATIGEFALREYLKLHHQLAGKTLYKLFHLRPKWHMLHHIFLSLVGAGEDRINPYLEVCWMDEDFLKKVRPSPGIVTR